MGCWKKNARRCSHSSFGSFGSGRRRKSNPQIRLTIQALIAYNTELSSRGVSGTLNQQSAIVGVMFRRESWRWSCPSQVALTSGSCAMGIHEPGQGRNTAALSGNSHVPQGRLEGVNCEGNVYCEDSKRDARFFIINFCLARGAGNRFWVIEDMSRCTLGEGAIVVVYMI